MSIDSPQDVAALKRIGSIVARTLRLMREAARPGMTTRELDEIGAAFLRDQGARSAPQVTYDFPGATCISVNHEVAHGVPGNTRLRAGDLVNVDVSAELGGYFADTGASFVLPPSTSSLDALCAATQGALQAALKVARAGLPLNGIGRAIEEHATARGYSIIKNLGSHGIGRALHEEPSEIPGYYDPKDTRVLTEGLVITIEPFLSDGAWAVHEGGDGWTLKTARRFRSAQYEHTLIVTRDEPIILTA